MPICLFSVWHIESSPSVLSPAEKVIATVLRLSVDPMPSDTRELMNGNRRSFESVKVDSWSQYGIIAGPHKVFIHLSESMVCFSRLIVIFVFMREQGRIHIGKKTAWGWESTDVACWLNGIQPH
jgi:hypothetical protein